MATNQDTIEDVFARFSLQSNEESDGIEPGTLQSQINSRDRSLVDELDPDLEYEDLKFTDRCLGSGAFSKVYEAVLRRSYLGYREVAIKSILGDLNQAEIDILRQFKDTPHPNIIQFLGYIKRDREHLIVTELAKCGSLFKFLNKNPEEPIPEFVIHKWLMCIAAGLKFLHERNVVHRDIKSPNCLLYLGCVVKICDFGISRQTDTTIQTSHAKGTIRWMAPEMRESKKFSKPSDIYTFGMVALEMCTRQIPFVELGERQLWLRDARVFPKIPDGCSTFLRQLMFSCWKPERNDRPNVDVILCQLEEEDTRLDGYESEIEQWEEQHFPEDHCIHSLVSVADEDRAQRQYAERETAVYMEDQLPPTVRPEVQNETSFEIKTEDMYGPSPQYRHESYVATDDMYGPSPSPLPLPQRLVSTRTRRSAARSQPPEGEAKLIGVYGAKPTNTHQKSDSAQEAATIPHEAAAYNKSPSSHRDIEHPRQRATGPYEDLAAAYYKHSSGHGSTKKPPLAADFKASSGVRGGKNRPAPRAAEPPYYEALAAAAYHKASSGREGMDGPAVEERLKVTEVPLKAACSPVESSKGPQMEPRHKDMESTPPVSPIIAGAFVGNEEAPHIAHRHATSLEVALEGAPHGTLSNKKCMLSSYMSHLQVSISPDGFSARPMTEGGFAYIWAGIKATHGVRKGKVCFEVKVTEDLDVPQMSDEEEHKHVVRVGWSTVDSSLKLGTDLLSYGYGGTAYKSHWEMFSTYGETFGKGDVITSYVDLTDKCPVISFSKNGCDLGVAFFVKDDLEGRALYPHVLIKNAAVEVNFGQKKPLFALKDGFTFIRNISSNHCVLGPQSPVSTKQCEVLMMIGLTGSGKTTWVKKHCKENPDKHYVVLGTNQIMDEMKIKNLPRDYKERFDRLIEEAYPCYNQLLEIAVQRKHNYVLDQTNLYPKARKRKLVPFEDFIRKAVVIVPSKEDYEKRFKKQTVNDGKVIPGEEINKMKGNFRLPDESQVAHLFHEVTYAELQQDDAEALLIEYKEEIAAML